MQSDLTTNEKIHLCIENKLSNQINLFINSNLHAKLPKINKERAVDAFLLSNQRKDRRIWEEVGETGEFNWWWVLWISPEILWEYLRSKKDYSLVILKWGVFFWQNSVNYIQQKGWHLSRKQSVLPHKMSSYMKHMEMNKVKANGSKTTSNIRECLHKIHAVFRDLG